MKIFKDAAHWVRRQFRSHTGRSLLVTITALTLALLFSLMLILQPFSCSRGADAPVAYVPFEYPEGVSFAEVGPEIEMSDEARYAAYDREDDPANPVLDVKVDLSISNLGSRPGVPRPQDSYDLPTSAPTPSPTPTPTSTPSPTQELLPVPTPTFSFDPGKLLPSTQQPEGTPNPEQTVLYITQPKVSGPLFTGDTYTIRWTYTSQRIATFAVSISHDGGKSFTELANRLTGDAYELTLPDEPGEDCLLRVTAYVYAVDYAHADTLPFALLVTPEPTPTPTPKPTPKPTPTPDVNYVNPNLQYTQASNIRISNALDEPIWFKAESQAGEANRLVWQLSRTPFWGTKASFGDEKGLIATGKIDMALGGEFSIDLKAPLMEQGGAQAPELSQQSGYSFYMRVVALDDKDMCIGDPGTGLRFGIGMSDTIPNQTSKDYVKSSDIELKLYMKYQTNETRWLSPNVFPLGVERNLSNHGDLVHLSGKEGTQGEELLRKAVQIGLQVATSPFDDTSMQGFTSPVGLVHTTLDIAPRIIQDKDGEWYYITPRTPTENKELVYGDFVPTEEELEAMGGGIYYYARAIVYVPDALNPAVLRPYPSDSFKIIFRTHGIYKYETKKVVVPSHIPCVKFLRYVPVQWRHPNYKEYFEVTRHIQAEEMNFTIRNKKTGEFLLPYKKHVEKYGWTRWQYQELLDRMLPVGAVFQYSKPEPGPLTKLFNEFTSLLSDIYNSVKNAFTQAKSAVISFVVDHIPFIGDTTREYLRKAVTFLVDCGLAYIGLPPELPNLDKLAAGGLDYLVEMAVSETLAAAGVPIDGVIAAEISEEVRQQVEDAVAAELKKAMEAQKINPFDVDFLRLSSKHLYEPAYVDVSIWNYSKTYYSTTGWLTMYFGSGFNLYNTESVRIPSFKPGEGTVVRVYLRHLRWARDVPGQYFDDIYYGRKTPLPEMDIYASFDLPEARVTAEALGIPPAPLPDRTEFVYDHPNYNYERKFVPAESIMKEDDSVNPVDFFDDDFFDKFHD
ncbi:MAG: hypothetical protein ACOX0U_03565 [Oscillospiraceae bacterium]|jgi:hypothetical protein